MKSQAVLALVVIAFCFQNFAPDIAMGGLGPRRSSLATPIDANAPVATEPDRASLESAAPENALGNALEGIENVATTQETGTELVELESLDPLDRSEAPIAPRAAAETDKDTNTEVAPTVASAEPVLIRGEFEKVVCIDEGTLAVRSEDLKNTMFLARRGDRVKVFQGWGENKKTKTIDKVEHSFVKVQIEREKDNEENIGWIAAGYVKPKAECAPLVSRRQSPPKVAKVKTSTGKGLADPNCCVFPLKTRPEASYLNGQRMFGANRSGGRTHAACDLYLNINAPVRAVAAGTVLTGLYYFYEDTFAIEVKHAGGFVVRYGELTAKSLKGISAGKQVKAGQTLGLMGKVSSGCCEPMLHFELFRGNKKGSLSQRGNRFQRRSDLLNPTKHLMRWEDNL